MSGSGARQKSARPRHKSAWALCLHLPDSSRRRRRRRHRLRRRRTCHVCIVGSAPCHICHICVPFHSESDSLAPWRAGPLFTFVDPIGPGPWATGPWPMGP